jgi:hypothetical protein
MLDQLSRTNRTVLALLQLMSCKSCTGDFDASRWPPARLRVRHDGAGSAKGGSHGAVIPESEALHPADFTIREGGVVRLNPELARHVAGLAAHLN